MRKAKIQKWYEIVDEENCSINHTQNYKQALKIKREYESK